VAIVMKRMAASVLPLLLASLACGAVPPRPHLVRRASAAQVRPTVTARPATGPLLVATGAGAATPASNARGFSTAWGVCGFLSILASAIRRLAPIALQPFARRDISPLQWGAYGGMVLGFAYVEGYGAFQKKFSPLVVRRAMSLTQAGAALSHRLLAPFYSMGLFHATKKRKIVAWSVSMGVFLLVGMVKRLPYPWRSIVDAGVCSGLCWGGASIVAFYVKALLGNPPEVSPELPG